VCAACLQPIDLTHRAHVLDRLKRDAETTAREHRRLLQSLRAAESEAVKAERRRRDEMAAANRARADASARAAAAANRARDAQARLRAVRDARVNAHVVAAAMARAEALVAASPVAPVQVPTPSDANNLSGTTTVRNPGHSPQHMSGNAPALALVAAVETAVSDAERAFRQLETRSRDRSNAAATATANPHDMEVASLQSQADVEAAELEARREEAAAAEAALATAQRADSAFGTRGIQSYLFEGALGELSARVGDYMEALTGGALAMELRPAAVGEPNGGSTRRRRRGRAAAGDAGGADAEDEDGVDERGAPSVAAAEKIEKVIFAQSHDGERVQRSLRQLSGGERRRAALALALAHADLASARGGVGCDLLVLDEVLQHLDGEGIARVAALLRSLPKGTVLLTSQADSATSHLFDVVDRVFKKNGASGVATGCDAAFGTDEDEDEVAAVFS
jgi:DNA repair exonuclease SbcCD ATPase subunit